MQQIAEQALTLKIYEEMTIKLYEILRQLQKEREEMENRIRQLEQIVIVKDNRIEQLTNKLNKTQLSQKLIQSNHVAVLDHYESQPVLGQCHDYQSIIAKSKKSHQFPVKVDINSYFTTLINQITQQSSKTINNNNQSFNSEEKIPSLTDCPKSSHSSQNQHQIIFQTSNQIIKNLPLNLQKIQKKQTTEQSFINQLFPSKSQKQNLINLSTLKSQKLYPISINSEQNQQNFFAYSNQLISPKQPTQKGWKSSNFIHTNVKPRKIPFTVIKSPNLKV